MGGVDWGMRWWTGPTFLSELLADAIQILVTGIAVPEPGGIAPHVEMNILNHHPHHKPPPRRCIALKASNHKRRILLPQRTKATKHIRPSPRMMSNILLINRIDLIRIRRDPPTNHEIHIIKRRHKSRNQLLIALKRNQARRRERLDPILRNPITRRNHPTRSRRVRVERTRLKQLRTHRHAIELTQQLRRDRLSPRQRIRSRLLLRPPHLRRATTIPHQRQRPHLRRRREGSTPHRLPRRAAPGARIMLEPHGALARHLLAEDVDLLLQLAGVLLVLAGGVVLGGFVARDLVLEARDGVVEEEDVVVVFPALGGGGVALFAGAVAFGGGAVALGHAVGEEAELVVEDGGEVGCVEGGFGGGGGAFHGVLGGGGRHGFGLR